MARKLGIDLTSVTGSGPQVRILIEDLSQQVQTSGPRSANRGLAEQPRPDYGAPGTRVKLAGLRRKIAEHMVEATRRIPHYSYIDECEITDLVRLRGQLREPFAAAEAYRRAAELDPYEYEIWYNLGNACAELGRLDEATQAFRTALARHDGDPEVWNNLGNALLESGDRAEAIRCFRRALEIEPSYDLSWNNLGNALEDEGRLEEATEAYGKAVDLAPDRSTYRLNLASALARTRQLEAAFRHLSRAVSLAPGIRGLLAGFAEFGPILSDPRFSQDGGSV